MQFSKRIKLPLIPSLLESNEMPASLALTLQHQCYLLHRDQSTKISPCILVTLHLEALKLFTTFSSNKLILFGNEKIDIESISKFHDLSVKTYQRWEAILRS